MRLKNEIFRANQLSLYFNAFPAGDFEDRTRLVGFPLLFPAWYRLHARVGEMRRSSHNLFTRMLIARRFQFGGNNYQIDIAPLIG